ncbi:hypothetical protein IT568_12570 [bacterium]|nr:hypothetical protein [bacterium]
MSFCPICKSEFREGFTFCSECKTELVDELVEEKMLAELVEQGYEIFENWVCVKTFSEVYEAKQIVGLLGDNSVHAEILSQSDSMFKLPGSFSLVRVMVQVENFKKAKELLKNYA